MCPFFHCLLLNELSEEPEPNKVNVCILVLEGLEGLGGE